MDKRIHAVITGRVQGVGFRSFVEDEADRLGITGWVRNLYSGEVEVIAEGNEDDLKEFCEKISNGPSLSYITDFKLEWLQATAEYSNFNIRGTYISD